MKGLTITVADDGSGYSLSEFDGDLRELQAAVGGYVEAIPTADAVTMWVNEEGKINVLPVNRLAMDVWIRFDAYGCMRAGDWIAGSCVVTGGTGKRGETLDLPAQWRRWVLYVARDAGVHLGGGEQR